MAFIFVTQSLSKHKEAERILGFPIERHVLDLPEIQAVDVEPVAVFKARTAFETLRAPVMVEDTGLFLEAWNGLPGALIRWFDERVGVGGICEMLPQGASRTALAKSIVVTYDGVSDPVLFVGSLQGRIAMRPVGTNGFGWDRIFIPDGDDRTFAQMLPAEKDNYSMRRQALALMAEHLGAISQSGGEKR